MHDLVDSFLDHLRLERGRSPHTIKTYALALHRFADWSAQQPEKVPHARAITSDLLLRFLEHERARPLAEKAQSQRLSRASLYLQVAAIRAFFRFCEAEGVIPSNPAELLSLPRRDKTLPKALTSVEMNRLLAPPLTSSPEALCTHAILEVAYASGLRLAELRGLIWSNCTWRQGF